MKTPSKMRITLKTRQHKNTVCILNYTPVAGIHMALDILRFALFLGSSNLYFSVAYGKFFLHCAVLRIKSQKDQKYYEFFQINNLVH